MKTSKCNSSIACLIMLAIVLALPGQMRGQSAAANQPSDNATSTRGWEIQVRQIDSAALDLSYSFQVAIYENLLEELQKTKQFPHIFRDGDIKAGQVPNLLVLRTTVEKYTPGSETQRAVTTVSGATKLTVRTQLVTREGKIVLERNVNGQVRFFGSNLRATHNLARNIAKALKQSQVPGPGRPI